MNLLDPQSPSVWRDEFPIRSDTVYLNHGSFGPSARGVRQRQADWKRQLDEQPMDFFVRRLEPAWFDARRALGQFVGARPENLAFVENATSGMNVVANSLPLAPGDEILLNDQEYGAVQRIWRRVAEQTGARVVQVELPWPIEAPEQIVDSLLRAMGPATRLLVISHVTSPTAVTMPIAEVTRRAAERGIAVCIDGPHAPAYLPLEIDALGCDYYVACCHKWLSAPLGSGFLYVAPRRQSTIRVPYLSWGRLLPGRPETWSDELLWSGTRDPSAYLSIPAAIEFLAGVGFDLFRARTHALARHARATLAEMFGTVPGTPDSELWYGSMAHVPLPHVDASELQGRLWREYGIEVPIVEWRRQGFIRVSCHLYNDISDLEKLFRALHALLR